jgi:uroporphyrinogen decarboxylase
MSQPRDPVSSRARVMAALSHVQPDRVPIDLGSTIVTGISLTAYSRLKTYLGLDATEVKIFDRVAQIAVVDEIVLDAFGVDTRSVVVGLAENRPPVDDPDRDAFRDEWGLMRVYSTQTHSYFVENSPLGGEISLHDILTYDWPDPADPGRVGGLDAQIDQLREAGDHAFVMTIPANFILTSMLLRGFEQWYMDTVLDPDLVAGLMDQVLEVQMAMTEIILGHVGTQIDVVFNLDDLAIQDRLMVSMPTYRKLLEPRLGRLYEFVRSKTSAKIVHHTDGAVGPLLASLADMGVDAVNPVQISARGMEDTTTLKHEHGDRLAFWGAIDTQQVLPSGTPEDVRQEVERRIAHLSPGGGYVLASVHNIQGDVPPENVVAMFQAALGRTIEFLPGAS